MTARRRRTIARTVWAVGSSAAMVAVLAACSAGTAESAGDAEPTAGGDFTYAQVAFTTCVDAAQANWVGTAQDQVVDRLVDQDVETGEIVPWLASSWETENNGTRFVFQLQEGVTFSNGEVLDAAAVKANFDNLRELGALGKAGIANSYLLNYVSSEVVDDLTVAVDFSTVKAGFLQALSTMSLGIVAPESLADTPENRCANGVIGSGPFVVSEIVQGDKIVLTKRTGYDWPTANAQHSGEAYLDTLTVQVVPEDDIRVGGVTSGQLNGAYSIPATAIEAVESSEATLLAPSVGGVVPQLYPNIKKPVFQDAAVRQALQVGINRQEIVDTIYSEYDRAATSVVGENVPGWIDLSDKLAYDPDGAAELLDDAGWVLGSDGIREKDGTPLSFTFKFRSVQDQPQFELIQQQLKEIGIDFQIALVPEAELLSWEAGDQWDFLYGNPNRPDGDSLLNNFAPTFSWWQKPLKLTADPYPALTSLLEKQSGEVDTAARSADIAQIQELIVDEGYAIPIREFSPIIALSPTSHGLWLNTVQGPNFYDTWIEN